MTTDILDPDEPLANDPPAYEYSWDFDYGLGPWTTWLAPSVVHEVGGQYESFTRLNAPGLLDPNHIDGIGSLRLIAHLNVGVPGAPGIMNLTDAEFQITIRATDFNANGGKLVVWLTRHIPEENVTRNYFAALTATNWANTGNDLTSQLVEGEWVTITVQLTPDLAGWTYAGENHTQQGDWADRYQFTDLPGTLSHMDSTLHLVMINDEPDEFPTGFLDIANITVRTHTPATPVGVGHDGLELFYGLEDEAVMGTLAGDASIPLGLFSVVEGSATNGTVTIDAVTGAFTFTANADYYGPTDFVGPATFRYVVSNGIDTSVERTAYLFVGGVNDAPVASIQDESTEIAANAAFISTIRIGTDVDVDERLTYEIVEGSATNGTVTIDAENGRYIFTPTAGFSGTASFSYRVSDGQLDSDAKTVTFNVLPPGQQPHRLTYLEAEQQLIAGDLQAFVRAVILLADTGDVGAAYYYGTWLRYGQHVPKDTELAAHYLSMATSVPEGVLILADMYASGEGVDRDFGQARTLLQALPNNAEALYRLAILYDNGFGGPVDDALAVATYLKAAKLGNADAMYTLGRRYLSGEGVAQSAADAYFWIGVGLKLDGGPDFAVFDQLLLHNQGLAIELGLTEEQVSELDLAVADWTVGQPSPVNDAPIAADAPDSVTGPRNVAINGTLTPATDVDGDHLTYQIVDGSVLNGSVTLDPVTGAYSFTPAAGYFGPAEFRYFVTDGQTVSAEVVVAFVFEKTTLAATDASGVDEAGTLTVAAAEGLLANDDVSDAGGSIAISAVQGQGSNVGQPVAGTYGSITINADGSYVFVTNKASETLTEGQSATESFTYTIVDGLGVTSTATLVITVTGLSGTVLIGDGTLIGTAFDDVLTGGNASDVIVGGAGDDLLTGGDVLGNEIYGGTGNDTFVVTVTGDTLVEFENEGTDTVLTALTSYTMRDHIENLTFTGTGAFEGIGSAQDNVITGGASNDLLNGLGGNDTLIGGLGADALNGGSGVDTANYAASGAGVTIGVRGQAGSGGDAAGDVLTEIENLIGSGFDDVLTGGVGANTLDGGAGVDTVDYGSAAAGVTANLNSGQTSNDGDGGADLLVSIENVTGSAFDDLLIGDAVGNILTGGLGGDTLIGLAGDDVLIGGTGASNALQGGTGNDRYIVSVAGDSLLEFADEGTDTVETDLTSYTLRDHFENLTYTGAANFVGLGNALDNILTGAAGDDLLTGGAGADTLHGAGGFDTASYSGSSAGVVVNLRTGTGLGGDAQGDVLTGIEAVTGTAFDDTLSGGAGNNTLNGGGGIDTVDYSGAAAGVTVKLNGAVTSDDGDGGVDTLVGIENATGSNFADLLIGDAGANVLSGGLGGDTLLGLAGDDVLIGGTGASNSLQGGTGNDRYIVSIAGDSLLEFADEGTDTVETNVAAYTLREHFENLVFTGTGAFAGTGNALANVITGGTGDDILRGGAGNDTLIGGAGLDTADYAAAAAGVSVNLNTQRATNDGDSAGADVLSSIENATGSGFNDTLIGNAVSNVLSGGLGADYLIGLAGDDVLIGGAGASNTMQGGIGNDRYVVSVGGDTLLEYAGEGIDIVETALSTFTLKAHFENLTFTGTGAFTGVGNDDHNILTGGAGNDILRGGLGNDTLIGGAGSDTADYAEAGGAVTVNLRTQTATGAAGADSFSSIENVTGSAFNDILFGGVGANTLNGGAGIDTVDYSGAAGAVTVKLAAKLATADGDGGTDVLNNVENITGSDFNDLLIGDGAANVLSGGLGADVLLGQGGDDVLIGGNGAGNTLQGGTGNDRYVVTVVADSLVEFAGEGTDTVETTLGSYGLRDHFENLTFTGTGAFVGVGNAAANTLTGGSGNDTLTGGAGNDTLNGGDGSDTVVLAGLMSDYVITWHGGGSATVVDNAPGVDGNDGTDTLTGIEFLRFRDGTVLDLSTLPVTLPPEPVGKGETAVPETLPVLIDDLFMGTFDAVDLSPQMGPLDAAIGLLPGEVGRLFEQQFTLAFGEAPVVEPVQPQDRPAAHDPDWFF